MALFPDPTTAASERSSVKNRLTGSRRRGSGINRHRSRTVSKTSLRGLQAQGAGASKGGCRARASATSRKTRKIRQTFRSCLSSLTRSCIWNCVPEVPVQQMAQGTPPLSARRGLPRWLQPASSTSPWLFTKSQVKSSQKNLPS